MGQFTKSKSKSGTGKGKYVTDGTSNRRFSDTTSLTNFLKNNPGWILGMVKLRPVSEVTRDKHRKNMLGNTRASGPNKVKRPPLSQEHKDQISRTLTGKTHSDATKRKMSLAHKGRISPMKGKKHKESSKRKISRLTAGKNNPFYGRSHTEETKNLLSRAMVEYMKENPARYQSSIELKIIDYLSNYFLVTPQFYLEDFNHAYDMLVELPNGVDLIIEYDGTYWHRDQDYCNDERKLMAESNGYEFLVIKEKDYFESGEMSHVKSEVVNYYFPLKSMSLKQLNHE